MVVKNLNGTSDNKCKCGSWIKHWENYSNSRTSYCCVDGCYNTDIVGGHVQKDCDTDKNWYIIPICKMHNGKFGEDLDIRAWTMLVSANRTETCEKSEDYSDKEVKIIKGSWDSIPREKKTKGLW